MTSLREQLKPVRVETPDIDDEGLYSTISSGAYLGFQATTMRNSRHSGRLAGVKAPAFIKMGTVVRYRGKTLKVWRDQFTERLTTDNATAREEI
jgi:hypothetical protein